MGLNYLGCFKDSGNRDLTRISANTSPKECFKQARNRGFEFAAMQNGAECYGGNKVGKYGSVNDKECSKECNQEKGMKCGGTWRNSVWFTGGVSYKKHLNHCASASNKDIQEAKFKNVELKDCMEACTSNPKCSAVEWYEKGWQGTRCYHVNQGWLDQRATKAMPKRRWRDAECYTREGKYAD